MADDTDAKDIESITFGILSSEEIKRIAVCKIDSAKMTGPGSVYDERMGSLVETPTSACETCGLKTRMCPGHFGYIELTESIIHPLFVKMVSVLLKCICKKCYRLIIEEDQIKLWGFTRYVGEQKFLKILEKLEKVNICAHCQSPQPKVVFKSKEGTILLEYKHKVTEMDEKQRRKVNKISIVLTVDEIKKIFDNVPDEDVEMMGFNPQLIHPRNMIMSVFPVLPPCARPYIVTNGNVCNDDLTTQITEIVKDNIKLSKLSDEMDDEKKRHKRQKLINSLKFHISTFYNNSKGKAKHPTDNKPIKGLKERLVSKEGQIRQNHMGKRVEFSARTVIGPDPTLKMGQLAIPVEISKILTFPEKVTVFNINKLTELIDNNKANFVLRWDPKKERLERVHLRYTLFQKGTKLLHGDIIVRDPEETLYEDDEGNLTARNHIVVKNDEQTLQVGDRVIRKGKLLENLKFPLRKKFKLRVGDIVERHLRDGDIVLLNRQPTLHKGSMLAFEIVIKPHKTFRINLATTKTYNADFDFNADFKSPNQ